MSDKLQFVDRESSLGRRREEISRMSNLLELVDVPFSRVEFQFLPKMILLEVLEIPPALAAWSFNFNLRRSD
jgi:hypothetical protein